MKNFNRYRLNYYLLHFITSKYTKKIMRILIFKLFNFNSKKNSIQIGDLSINQIYESYNFAFMNERSIEIPFTKFLLSKYLKSNNLLRILEIGNTLKNYEDGSNFIPRIILDKYEKEENVLNVDIIDFEAPEKFDLIFSISTLEHVGSDYGEENNDSKFLDCINHLINNLLTDNGVFIVTLPLYYREVVDSFILDNKLDMKKYFFIRENYRNNWSLSTEQYIKENKLNLVYNNKYPCANAVFVGVIEK